MRQQELQKLDEFIKARFVELFGDPVSNSYGLPEATLPDLGEFGRGVSKHRPRNDIKLLGGKYPLIQTGDVANAGLYITSYSSTYSELGLKQSKMWDKGTLCITIAANIAKTAILEFDACFPDSVVGFIANERTNNIFVHYWFSFFQAILESQAPESAQKNINLKILSELKVIVPEKRKQDQFASFVKLTDKSKVAWFRFNLENLNKMDFDEKDRAEFELREGDLLVCEGGEIGRCAVWHNELQPCFFQKALHRVRCNHQIILPDYLAWWFRYNCDYGGFSALAGAKATIAHLPGAKLKQLQVAVPPMELQEQFAVFVAQTDKSKVAVRKY